MERSAFKPAFLLILLVIAASLDDSWMMGVEGRRVVTISCKKDADCEFKCGCPEAGCRCDGGLCLCPGETVPPSAETIMGKLQ
ncbi:defensin-like protein 287 [Tripterygium wilfordii]|uniref:defensin-like protein 287 n=1 Tax=Tripterygium wilfordii TaxID=458696 RepID=UPI0018F7ECBD|nr:defensin-like protein 287 [Tripterygium wilfordii]